MKTSQLQILAVILPTIIQIIYHLIGSHNFYFEFTYLFEGLILLWVFKLFLNRYIATLTDSFIELVNLFGQHLSIPLNTVTKLEQKKNVFSLVRDLKFLNLSKKTGITFSDESLDEFEVNIFTKAFNSNIIFDKIIDHANKCGNGKIRQYII